MQPAVENKLRGYFFNAFSAPYTGSNVDWLTENAKVDGNEFKISDCTWLKDIFAAVENPDVEMVIVQGAAGTFKTTFQDLCDAWFITEQPGKILRVFYNDDMARDFTKMRLIPILEDCPPVAALCEKGKVRTSHGLVVFPHMEIKSSGPSEKIQFAYSTNYLQIDEAHLLTVPIENFFKRVRKNYQNRKIIITSTCGEQQFDKDGKLIGDQLCKLVNETTIKRRAWKCPNCSEYNTWRWSRKREDGERPSYSGINWGKPILKPEGGVDEIATAANAKLECHFCRHLLDDKASVRKSLEQSAIYQTIKEGNPKRLTFQYPAWAAPFHSFADSVKEYFKAKDLADSRQYDKLKNFYQQVITEEWNKKAEKVRSKLTFQKFDSLGEWTDEKFRFMEIDVQGNSLWYWMITAFDAAGNGRLIKYGEAHSWPELEQISVTHKVVLPTGERAHHVGVDGNYLTGDVAKQTVLRGVDDVTTDADGNQWKEHYGWLMLRGDDRKRFKWPDGIERAIGPQEWYSEGFAADLPPARQHWWSNYAIKNLVASIRDGHNKLKLVVNTTDENLNAQLYSEYPDEFGNWKEKSSQNHYWDTLCMAYAHGLLAGIPFLGADEKVPV